MSKEEKKKEKKIMSGKTLKEESNDAERWMRKSGDKLNFWKVVKPIFKSFFFFKKERFKKKKKLLIMFSCKMNTGVFFVCFSK